MPLKSSLRWSLYDRALALGPFLLGLLIALAGVYLGAGAFLDELAFGDPSDAGSPESLPLLVGGIVVGLLVWQVGRSAVRHHAMQVAIENRVGELVDEERIASAAATKVDDRIADVETDVEQVSRKTTRLEQQMRGDELGEDALEPSPTSTGGAEPADAAAAGAAGTSAEGEADPISDADDADPVSDADDADPVSDADDAPESEAGDSTAAETDDAAESGSAGDDDAEMTADSTPDRESTPSEDASDAGAADDDDDASDAEGADDDGFEWEDGSENGEYYRNN